MWKGMKGIEDGWTRRTLMAPLAYCAWPESMEAWSLEDMVDNGVLVITRLRTEMYWDCLVYMIQDTECWKMKVK